MTFKKTVGAYLTGWVIAQVTYNHLTKQLCINERDKLIRDISYAVEMRLRTEAEPDAEVLG